MRTCIFWLLLCLLAGISIHSFGNIAPDKEQDSDNHIHLKNELAISNLAIYLFKEKAIAYGLHFHYIRNISDTGFGIGAGYERAFTNHKHNTFGLIAAFRPVERLGLNLSPGITFEDDNKKPGFEMHFESTYDLFELKNLDVGPQLEFAWEKEDYHLSLGIHVCFCF